MEVLRHREAFGVKSFPTQAGPLYRNLSLGNPVNRFNPNRPLKAQGSLMRRSSEARGLWAFDKRAADA